MINIDTSNNVYKIIARKNKNIFKNEELTFTSKIQKEIIRDVFEHLANSEAKGSLKKGWKKPSKEKNAAFFEALSQMTGKKDSDVRKEVAAYVCENRLKVIKLTELISEKTGINLTQIEQEDFLVLVAGKEKNWIKGAISFLKDNPKMNAQLVANFVLAQLAAEIFNINITIREFEMAYDDSMGGSAKEKIKMVTIVKKDAPHLDLAQGWAIMNKGMLFNNESHIFHIEPKIIT